MVHPEPHLAHVPHHVSRSRQYFGGGAGHQRRVRLRQDHHGGDLQRLRLGLCLVSGSRRLVERSVRPAHRARRDRRLLVGHDGGDGRRHRGHLLHRRAFHVRRRRSRCVPWRDARDAAVVSARGTRLRARDHPQREPARRCDCAAARGLGYEHLRLASGVLYLRFDWPHLGGVVVRELSQPAGRARSRESGGAALHPRRRREGRSAPRRGADQGGRRAVGHAAAVAEHVGDHVRLLHLRLLPLDFPELAAVLPRRVPPFHAHQDRHLRIAAAVCRRHRRYRWRAGDRLAPEEDRQRAARAALGRDRRPVGLRRVHRPGGADGGPICRRLLPHGRDVLPRMHHRPVVGGAHGRRRQILGTACRA